MLTSLKSMLEFRVCTTNGHLGTVDDFSLDVDTWRLKYVVARLGVHYPWHNVLIPAETVSQPDWVEGTLHVNQTRSDIRHDLRVSADPPIHIQNQWHALNYYIWACHWTPFSGQPEPDPEFRPWPGSHRRSLKHLLGYRVRTADCEAGCLDDLIVDGATWQIRMVVTDIGSWAPGKRVLALVRSVRAISFNDRAVYFDLDRAALIDAPEFDSLRLDDASIEKRLMEHYSRISQHA